MKSPQINVAPKVMTLEQAVEWRKELQKQGKKLAVTNGCFDILHRGHAEYLQSARNTADALLVLVNADASVRSARNLTVHFCWHAWNLLMLLSFLILRDATKNWKH